MNRAPQLDPEDPAGSDLVEARLAQALAPAGVPADIRAVVRQRLLQRARASRVASGRVIHVRRDQGRWHHLGKGVRFKLLHESHRGRSVLVDLPPGGSLPTHRHHEHEECVVLGGSAQLGGFTVYAGDYHVALAGSRHGQVSSRDGALLYLRGVPIGDRAEVVRDLVTAWLPGKGPPPITVRADEGHWQDIAPGVATKALWQHEGARSLFVHMQPGARIDSATAVGDERLLLEGELFAGDRLLRAGDFEYAANDLPAGEIETDVGSRFFARTTVHGARSSAGHS